MYEDDSPISSGASDEAVEAAKPEYWGTGFPWGPGFSPGGSMWPKPTAADAWFFFCYGISLYTLS